MARKKHLINVHTSTGTTAPTGASLYLGEIAVQHTPNDPGLWIKMGTSESSTEYEKFIGKTEITNIFNEAKILGSGYTYSGLSYVNSATTIADAYSALTNELFDDEKVTAAALNDLNNRLTDLAESIPPAVDLGPLSASVVNNQDNITNLSAVTITGVTMNGSPVTVTDKVANLGTVITAETQLSTATTGTGNVVGSIAVSNHKITTTMFSAASADQVSKLSAGTINLVGASAASVYSSAVSYVTSAISGLDSSTAVTAGNYITGIAIADGKISGITQAALPSAPAITASTAGTGNVFTAVSTTGHSMTFTKGITALTGVSTPNNDNYLSVSVASNSAITVGEKNTVVADKTALGNVSATGSLVDAKAVKDYVADQITSAVDYKGATSTLPSTAAVGDLYITSANIAIPANKSATGVAVTAETGDFIIARTAGTWDVIEKNLDGAITGTLTADTLTLGAGTNNVKSLANGTQGNVLVVGASGPQWTAGTLTDTATTHDGHYAPTGSTTGGTTATTSASAIKGLVYDDKGHVTSVVTGSVLTSFTETSISTGNGSSVASSPASVITGITTGGTNGHTLTLNKSNKIFSAVTSESANTVLSAVTSLSAQTAILGPGYTYSGLSYVNSATSVADAFSALTQELYDDEEVIASSLNDLNDKMLTGVSVNGTLAEVNSNVAYLDVPAPEMILGSGYTYSGISYVNSSTTIADAYSALTSELIDDEKVISAALNDLNGRVNELSSSTAALDYIQANEEVTAAALNELNNRVSTVETHMTGDYIPITGYMLASGSTEEELTLTEEDTVNEALGKLQKQMLDNEEAIAGGLNDLNERVEANAAAIAQNTGVTALSGAVRSLSAATYYGIGNLWDEFRYYTETATTQELSATVMSISAKTSGVLTINANGVQQGRYSPSANTTIDLQIIQEVTGADVLLTGYELASGTTEEELAIVATDTVNEAFGKIQKQNYDNEAVVAGALNDLDERIHDLEVSGVSASDLEDMEYVISEALNDLNGRILDLSGDTYYELSVVKAQIQEVSANTGGGGGGDYSALSSATYSHVNNSTVHITSTERTRWNNAWTSGVSAYTKVEALSAATTGHSGDTTRHITAAERTRWNNAWTSGVSAYTKVEALSAATTAHTANTTAHITSTERTNWNNAWTSGVSAYTRVNALSAATTAHTGNGDIHVTSAQKTNWTNSGTSGANAYVGYIAHSANTGIHVTSAQKTNWTNSGTSGANAYVGYIAHSANTTAHITSTERTNWNNAWTSGVSAYTKVEALSAATTAMSANVAKIAVTGVTVTGTGNAVTDASYSNSALTLTKGNVLTAETLTGVSTVGTALTVTNKVANIPSASSSTFGVVKTGNFITNTNGSIAVSTGTTNTTVARGDQFLAVSGATTANTSNLNAHSATTIANGTSTGMHLPTVTSSDSGKILQVNSSGAWALVTPITVYTGSDAPNNNQGQNGDIYLQTS